MNQEYGNWLPRAGSLLSPFAAVMFVLGLSACAPVDAPSSDSPEASNDRQTTIVNGTVINATDSDPFRRQLFRAVGYLDRSELLVEDGAYRQADRFNCTAFLIGPRTVLTSAHCVERQSVESSLNRPVRPAPGATSLLFSAHNGSVANQVSVAFREGSGEERFRVVSIAVPPQRYDPALNSFDYDVAVLQLERAVRERAPLRLNPAPVSFPQTVRIAGAGVSFDPQREPRFEGQPDPEIALDFQFRLSDPGAVVGTVGPTLPTRQPIPLVADSPSYLGPEVICGGDSGGPWLDRNGEVVAISSASIDTQADGFKCTPEQAGLSVGLSIRLVHNWIIEHLDKAHLVFEGYRFNSQHDASGAPTVCVATTIVNRGSRAARADSYSVLHQLRGGDRPVWTPAGLAPELPALVPGQSIASSWCVSRERGGRIAQTRFALSFSGPGRRFPKGNALIAGWRPDPRVTSSSFTRGPQSQSCLLLSLRDFGSRTGPGADRRVGIRVSQQGDGGTAIGGTVGNVPLNTGRGEPLMICPRDTIGADAFLTDRPISLEIDANNRLAEATENNNQLLVDPRANLHVRLGRGAFDADSGETCAEMVIRNTGAERVSQPFVVRVTTLRSQGVIIAQSSDADHVAIRDELGSGDELRRRVCINGPQGVKPVFIGLEVDLGDQIVESDESDNTIRAVVL